jgi:hypothetical protein
LASSRCEICRTARIPLSRERRFAGNIHETDKYRRRLSACSVLYLGLQKHNGCRKQNGNRQFHDGSRCRSHNIRKVTVRNFSSYTSLNKIIVRINYKDDYVQPECEYNNNEYEYDEKNILRAYNDFSDTLRATCDKLPITVKVLANDSLPEGCTTPTLTVVSQPSHGTATVVAGNRIEYTGTLSGYYTFTYRVKCGADSNDAQARIVVDGSSFVDDVWYFGENLAGTGNKSAGIRFIKNSAGVLNRMTRRTNQTSIRGKIR